MTSETFNVEDWEILTKDGYKPFKGIIENNDVESVKLYFDDGSDIICSNDHMFMTTKGKFREAQRCLYKKLKGFTKNRKVINIEYIGKQSLYDVVEVDGHQYITNDLVSHNCNMLMEFWASVYPIISSSKKSKIIMASTPKDTSGLFYKLYDDSCKGRNSWVNMKIVWNDVPGRDEAWRLETMNSLSDPALFNREFNCEFDEVGDAAIDHVAYEELRVYCREPLFELEDGCYKIWENPSPDRIYVAGVDVSEGIGKDYSVIQIIDITDPTSIQQVACYANNKIQPVHFTKKLREVLQNWGDPLACIERNGCGGGVVDNLRKDFNYVNIVNWGVREANIGTKKSAQLGMMCHTSTKNKAVGNYLYWVGTAKQVRFNDLQTVNEVRDFVRKKGGTHAAKAGSHDDRVMSLIWALMMLSDDLCDKFFEIVDKDMYHKPTIIRPMDYGIKYFYNPTSIYDNPDSREMLPTFLGSPIDGDPELDDLRSQGWKPYSG